MQYDINRILAKISSLSASKIYKYDYLKSEVILSPQQQRMTEDVKSPYSPLGKGFEKQTKTIKVQG